MSRKRMSRCPTPTKAAYVTKDDAIAAAVRVSTNLGPVRVYTCPCGNHHLTTKPAAERNSATDRGPS